jgi:hypothetical protein
MNPVGQIWYYTYVLNKEADGKFYNRIKGGLTG